MLVEAELPDDPALLQAMLVEARGEISRRDQEIIARDRETTTRDQEITTLRTVGAEADAEIERLTGIIAALQRHRFGARSEQLSEDQLSLAFEDRGGAGPRRGQARVRYPGSRAQAPQRQPRPASRPS